MDTKTIALQYGSDDIKIHKIEIDNCIIVNVLINGVCDTTFELPLSSPQTINILSHIEDDDIIEPRLIVGDASNIKIQLIAGQIGKIMLKSLDEPKAIILSIGLRWFGRDITDNDFQQLMFILEGIAKLN